MYENNYTYSPDSQNNENKGPENAAQVTEKKKKGMPKVAKAFLMIICMAAVSAGSIAGYKYIDENGIPFTGSKSVITAEKNQKLPPKEEEKEEPETKPLEKENFTSDSLVNIMPQGETLSTQAIYRKVLPSVVGVTSVFEYQQPSFNFWGFSSDSTTQEAAGTGTGIVMSSDGYILTNAHVISSDTYGVSTKISIRLSDEAEYEAVIVG